MKRMIRRKGIINNFFVLDESWDELGGDWKGLMIGGLEIMMWGDLGFVMCVGNFLGLRLNLSL